MMNMKGYFEVCKMIDRLKREAEKAEAITQEYIQNKRYEDAAKNMMRERSLKDQIALLEWVLK